MARSARTCMFHEVSTAMPKSVRKRPGRKRGRTDEKACAGRKRVRTGIRLAEWVMRIHEADMCAQLTVERGVHGQDEAALRLCRGLEDGVDDWTASIALHPVSSARSPGTERYREIRTVCEYVCHSGGIADAAEDW